MVETSLSQRSFQTPSPYKTLSELAEAESQAKKSDVDPRKESWAEGR
ncbi:hypothetical protein [Leptospira alexanderi]|nr:hypothetical protein [Leptospira alexanderi]